MITLDFITALFYEPMVLVSYKPPKECRPVKTNGPSFWACSRPTTPPRWSV